MIPNIEKQLAAMGPEKIKAIQERFTVGKIVPYPYQCVAYAEIAKRFRDYEHPFFVKASVSAGKTIIFAMVAAQCQRMNLPFMVLSRQAEIVDQDSDEISNFGVPNSVYCAGLNTKSAYFPIVVGSEGTVANGLFKALGDYGPKVLGIDECHQVDWEDLAEALENDESFEQMSTKKGDPVPNPEFDITNPVGNEYLTDPKTGDSLKGTGRSQYTIIIITLMRRCREKHGMEMRIFGMTGSEFRGTTPILVENKKFRGFWREQITNIDTDYLIKVGTVVPTVFGSTDGVKYDLDEFKATGIDGTQDFDAAQLRAMGKKIHESKSQTQKIMKMVAAKAETRNAVLITCADQRHCKEAAEALPEGSTYAIITQTTSAKRRKEILDDVRAGKIKYTFQVMALTTGVNVPNWDFSVLLRKIGSLTLLIQLLGRGMRLLKPHHVEQGMVKDDHLVWDFAGTMDELGQLYFHPVLEEAMYQRRGKDGKDPKKCPICDTENSFYARRCMHIDENGNRCEHYWTFRVCEDQIDDRTKKILVRGCGAKNDVVARVCRCCDVSLIDPNMKLTNKVYTKNDWCTVVGFNLGLTKNQNGVILNYRLRDMDGEEYNARQVYFPQSDNRICKVKWKNEAVNLHVIDPKMRSYFLGVRDARKIVQYATHFRAPVRVTHRKNAKGEDIISRKDFGDDNDNG